jgi:hypothetical protein
MCHRPLGFSTNPPPHSFLREGRGFQNAVEPRPSCRKRRLPGRRLASQEAERGREHDRIEGGRGGCCRGSLAGSLQVERPEMTGGGPTIRWSEPITFLAKRESGRRARGGVARSPAKRESSGAIKTTQSVFSAERKYRRFGPLCCQSGGAFTTYPSPRPHCSGRGDE